MKNVSFKIAKYLKDIGYPQELYYGVWYFADEDSVNAIPFCGIPLKKVYWIDPTYIEVWLWLWQEKKHYIKVLPIGVEFCWQILLRENNEWHSLGILSKTNFYDPEAAIIAAIEYLVDNDLIK